MLVSCLFYPSSWFCRLCTGQSKWSCADPKHETNRVFVEMAHLCSQNLLWIKKEKRGGTAVSVDVNLPLRINIINYLYHLKTIFKARKCSYSTGVIKHILSSSPSRQCHSSVWPDPWIVFCSIVNEPQSGNKESTHPHTLVWISPSQMLQMVDDCSFFLLIFFHMAKCDTATMSEKWPHKSACSRKIYQVCIKDKL